MRKSFESGWRTRLSWVLASVAALLMLLGAVADRADRVRHLELICDVTECRASVDGAAPLVRPRGYRPAGGNIGLYAYAPWENDSSQRFRNLVVRNTHGPLVDVSLESHDETPAGLMREGWTVGAGGLAPDRKPGSRSVSFVEGLRTKSFTLEVDLVDASDAGVLFHATGIAKGTVLVLRPKLNDMFFFELDDGRPGPVLEIGSLSELSVGRELLRLGGLVGWLLLASVAGLGLLRWLGRGFDPSPFRLSDCARWLDRASAPRWLLPALAVVGTTLGGLVAVFALGTVPHIPDETAYIFQAKIFAAGELWAPVPPALDFFLHEHIVQQEGRWFGKYPPLFPLLLAAGMLAGVPWLVNPLLGALTALAVYGLTSMLASWRWGLVAWLLTMSSPFFLIMNGTFMSHSASALFITLFVWSSLVAIRDHRLPPALAAGAALGFALFTRPYTALLAALAVAAYGLYLWIRNPAVTRVLITIAVGVSLFVAAFLAWTGAQSLDGSRPDRAYATYHASDTLGFGPQKGSGWLQTWGSWGHTPAKAVRSVYQYLDYSARHLLGWPLLLSFSLVLAHLIWGRTTPGSWLPLLLFAALIVGHMFYWATQHIGYGARYWFAATPGLMVVSALGLRALTRDRGGAIFAALATLVLVSVNLGGYLPDRLRELPEYGAVSSRLAREVERRELERALVFVRTEGLLFNDGFFMNDPFLESGTLFVRHLGRRNRELIRLYPEREAYVWDGTLLKRLRPAPGSG